MGNRPCICRPSTRRRSQRRSTPRVRPAMARSSYGGLTSNADFESEWRTSRCSNWFVRVDSRTACSRWNMDGFLRSVRKAGASSVSSANHARTPSRSIATCYCDMLMSAVAICQRRFGSNPKSARGGRHRGRNRPAARDQVQFAARGAELAQCAAGYRRGHGKRNCGLLLDAYHLARSGAGGRGCEDVPARKSSAFSTATCRQIRSPASSAGPTCSRAVKAAMHWRKVVGLLAEKITLAIFATRRRTRICGRARLTTSRAKGSNSRAGFSVTAYRI
jgi:hypothetical protein